MPVPPYLTRKTAPPSANGFCLIWKSSLTSQFYLDGAGGKVSSGTTSGNVLTKIDEAGTEGLVTTAPIVYLTNGSLYLAGKDFFGERLKLELVSLEGRVVLRKNLSFSGAGSGPVSLSGVRPGVYVLSLRSQTGILYLKKFTVF